jgi:hypothetical protein
VIISHRHRFIFIKTEKTAGTSIELALARICGPDDVISPVVHPADRALRDSLGPGYRTEQNYQIPWKYLTPLDLVRAVRRWHRPQFYNHMGASEIRRFVDPAVWRGYFKFCVERNPWDKVVSTYHWWRELERQHREDLVAFRQGLGRAANGVEWMIRNHPVGEQTLSQFIQSGRANLVNGFNLYSIDGEIVVDQVLEFSRLSQELSAVMQRLGVTDFPELPRAKAGVRKTGEHYRDVLTDADRQKIARVFAREIAYFGYEF